MLGLFVLLGMSVATWLARFPAIRDALELTPAALGRILLVGSLGSLVTVFVAGGIVARFGSRRVLWAAAVMFSTGAVLLGVGTALGSVAVFTLGVMAQAISFALGNVPINVETVTIERAMGRSVVPHFHAAFSIGSVIGSGIGALAAAQGVPVVAQFVLVAVATLIWRARSIPAAVLQAGPDVAGPGTRPGPAPAAARPADGRPAPGGGMRTALGAWREPRVLLIGLIVMAAALSEGTANNWLTLAVVDGFGASEATGAVVFGVFVAAMAGSRLLGARLIDRFGPVAVIAGSGVSGLVGLLAFVLAPGLPGAVAGVVLWGLGAGLPIPVAMTAVSADPLRAAGRVAVVSAFASVASLVAPPVIGLFAESVGTRTAVVAIAWALALSALLARVVRPEPATAADPGASEPAAPATPASGVPTQGGRRTGMRRLTGRAGVGAARPGDPDSAAAPRGVGCGSVAETAAAVGQDEAVPCEDDDPTLVPAGTAR